MSIKKIVSILLVLLFISNVIFLPKVYAKTASEIFSDGDNFLNSGNPTSKVLDEDKLKSVSSTIYKVLLTIAICVAVVIGAVLGFNFILGSVEGKAKIMEALVPYIVGCVVVFGAFGIWSMVVNIGNDLEGDITDITDTALQETREKNSEILQQVLDGKINSLSESDLIIAYQNNVEEYLRRWTATSADPRSGGHAVYGEDYGMSLEQALEKLKEKGDHYLVIYNELKTKGLLKEDGISVK